MNKKRLVVSYNNLSPELLEELKKKYPYGYTDYVIKVTKPNNDYFHAITLDTKDASYLIKVNVKIDSKPKDDEEDKGFYSDSENFGTESDSFPDDIEDEDDRTDSFDNDVFDGDDGL